MQEWKYYDFDEHWNEFLEVWKSEYVQEELDEAMISWGEDNPTYVYDDDERRIRVYKRGDPLWEFGRTDYWQCKIHDDFGDETDICAKAFLKAVINVHPGLIFRGKPKSGRVIPERDVDVESNFYMTSGAFHAQDEREHNKNAPKPDTLESMIMMVGKNFIRNPLFTAANKMFGYAELIEDIDGNSLILIPHKKIVFDLYNFYFITRDKDNSPSFVLQKDEYYDSRIDDDEYTDEDEIDENDSDLDELINFDVYEYTDEDEFKNIVTVKV